MIGSIWNTIKYSHWLMTLLVTTLVSALIYFDGVHSLEMTLYNMMMQYRAQEVNASVAVIAIDDKTRHSLGALSESRSQYADIIEKISQHAQVVGITVDLSSPQRSPEAVHLQKIYRVYQQTQDIQDLPDALAELQQFMQTLANIRARLATDQAKIKGFLEFYATSLLKRDFRKDLSDLKAQLNQAQAYLDSDSILASSLRKTHNVVLGISPALQQYAAMSASQLSAELAMHQLTNIQEDFEFSARSPQPPTLNQLYEPLNQFTQNAEAAGILLPTGDNFYQQPLVIKNNDLYFAALPLVLAAYYLGGTLADIEVQLGQGIKLNNIKIETDEELKIYPFFYKNSEFLTYSLTDLLEPEFDFTALQGKAALIGVTEYPSMPQYETPIGQMPAVIAVAHTLASLLNQHNLTKPQWQIIIQVAIFLCIFSYLAFVLSKLSTQIGLIITAALAAALLTLNGILLYHGWVIFLTLPIILLISGYAVFLLKKAIIAYQDVFRLHPDAVESNRLLGLAFQGQGHLEMAFEKYRLCPPDEAILGLLYNLALDYELKRQFNGAAAVYRYMLSRTPHFRDVQKRLDHLYRRLPRSGLAGGLGVAAKANGDFSFEDSVEKPTLGRYQVERQLGKGAMGLVYLGRDPKLDRLVAIKTLALSQEFEGEELQEATRRFFREASAAGRLKHPYIVSIYDAGEEQDLAYISMEFFKGGNLLAYCKPDNLLPIPSVIDITTKVAEALDYAFSQGVVHRDIKPANIMYNPASGKIKITDFGIARITDSNKTRTGVILGTPSYMSPEQLVGKQVDGRTDIFSLGVMLYQLLTGTLPFMADTIASLMYKIANEPHRQLRQLRADIPLCLQEIANKALEKAAQRRFQTGAELAHALRDCQHEILHNAQLDTEQDLQVSAPPSLHQPQGER